MRGLAVGEERLAVGGREEGLGGLRQAHVHV
jgi:hypothetical protein